eukprot:s975_g3.t1
MFIGFQHPTGILASIDGEDVHRKSRAHIVGLLEDFRGSIKVIPTDSFRAAMWISAQEALLRSSGSHPDAESKEGSDWHKTEVQLHSIHPMARDVEVGDYVVSIDGISVLDMGRGEVLEQLADIAGGMIFESGGGLFPWKPGSDWCGGLLIAWTAPPVIRAATTGAQKVFPDILPGDVLSKIDGRVVWELERKRILEQMASMNGRLSFIKPVYYMHIQAIRKDAQKALQTEPDNSSESLDWIAGILIRWSSPAEVQEVLPDVREFYPALSPGSRLQSVYGTGVCEMERADVLHLLAQSPIHATELVFEPRLTKQIQEKLHADAEMALQRGKKRHKDENLPEGYNWIAGVQILWSKPPRVLQVTEQARASFPLAVPGRVLAFVGLYMVFPWDNRRAILAKMADCKEFLCFVDDDRYMPVLRDFLDEAQNNCDYSREVRAACKDAALCLELFEYKKELLDIASRLGLE